jgi:hypothetical protein
MLIRGDGGKLLGQIFPDVAGRWYSAHASSLRPGRANSMATRVWPSTRFNPPSVYVVAARAQPASHDLFMR